MSRDDEPDVRAGSLTRRGFMAGSAASAMAALLASCDGNPPEDIVPYVDRPPELTPGVSRYYATAALRAGVAIGVLGESRDGRPIKIEGSPEHPFSLGATGPAEQALPLTLYDRDRLDRISRHDAPASFEELARAFGPFVERPFVRSRGEGLHLWMAPTTSPLIEHLLGRLYERYPRAEVWFDPASVPLTSWEATQRVLGRVLAPQYRFEDADRVLTLDSNFLMDEPGSIRWARGWSAHRLPESPGTMSRCYAVDPTPTGTSAALDHRLVVRPSEVGTIAAAMLAALGDTPAAASLEGRLEGAPHADWIRKVAADLAQHRGRTIVIAGEHQPAHVHVLALLLNAALDSFGKTITFTRAPWLRAGEDRFRPAPLIEALDAGAVDALFCLGANPAYSAQGTLAFADHARRAGETVVLAQFPNETTRLGDWVIPELHVLERWGDARAWDGTWTIIQPLLRPLFGGHAIESVLLALNGEQHDVVRRLLVDSLTSAGHDAREVLAQGFVPGSAFAEERVAPSWDALAHAIDELESVPRTERGRFELALRRAPHVEDGVRAENAWLQELPETMTKLVWDNAAIMAEEDVAELGLSQGDVVELVADAGRVRLPVLPMRAQARGTIVAWLGYGRTEGGSAARHVGVDLGVLRHRPDVWLLSDVELRKTGRHHDLAVTQLHHDLPPEEELQVIFRRSLSYLQHHPDFTRHADETPPSLYPNRLKGSPQWGMGIDLNLCMGCEACVIACQAENNLAVVGKTQVRLGREMHWLRIDRYFQRPEHVEGAETRIGMQPMLCQHCEQAPCEYVCPVNATVHSPDGLNEMVYNRCVGTRFCSNNCPYKVRRFNWLDWHRTAGPPESMVFNPDVTVRGRGVMEKCTYCVQRIRRAQIDATVEGRALADGDVVTACQQACPTQAIVFGDVSDPSSRVSRWLERRRAYAVLNDLGTQPRTRYLARIDNVNEELSRE